MAAIDSKGRVTTLFRLPAEMHKYLTERAAYNGRSFNSEVVQMIKEQMRKEGKAA